MVTAGDIVRLDARAVRASSRRRPGASFAPRVAVTRGSMLDHIVALLGRRPGWPA